MNSQEKFIMRKARREMKRRQRMIRASRKRVREALTRLAEDLDYLSYRMNAAARATIELTDADSSQ